MANKLQNEIKVDGVLGRDAEFQFTNSGKCIVKFAICYNSSKKNTKGGWDKVANWFDCQYWHDAESDRQLFVKGNLIKVTGELRQDKWIDKDTQKERSKLFINVSEVKLLDKNEVFGNNSQTSNQPTGYPNVVHEDKFSDDEFEDTDIPF